MPALLLCAPSRAPPEETATVTVRVLWEFDAEVEPKAVGVFSEKLSLLGSKETQVGFVQIETTGCSRTAS